METEEWTIILLSDMYTKGVVQKGSDILKELEKDKRILKEIKRLVSIFKTVDGNKLKIAKSLIENVAFMTITLEDLQKTINKDGAVSEYKNGENQFGTKKSPEIEIYNTMIKNHSSIIKQLTELAPGETTKTNELLNFISKASK